MIKKLKKVTLLDIKNNLAIILLFPALLGGLWQLLELSKMSISFIRFFSPTQLLPDGLLILFMLSAIYLAIQLGLLDGKRSFKRRILRISLSRPLNSSDYYIKPMGINKLVFHNNPIYHINVLWVHKLSIVLGFIILLMFISLVIIEVEEFTFVLFLALLSLFVLWLRLLSTSIVVLFVLFMDNKYDKFKKYFLNKPILKELLFLPLQFIILCVMLFLFVIFPLFFHKEFMLPENLKNLGAISSSLKDNNYTSNKISYFNDKYIFIEHTTEDKNITIEILKFDNLFKSN